MLKIEHLRKVFYDKNKQEIVAVNDLSFSCAKGEIVGLVGMNGAGKSTTLRMLSTVITPTSGSGTLGDLDLIEDSTKIRSQIGFLSGTTGLYKKLTARETLKYFADLAGLESEQSTQRINELVSILKMEEFIDRRCEKLSTGQKQKVNISRTIIHDPSLIILDEATTGLDVVAAKSIIDFIKSARNDGKSILFSTHHMEEIEELCDKIIIIHHGKTLAFGTKEEIREQFNGLSIREILVKEISSEGENNA